jgi:hypothetical protein
MRSKQARSSGSAATSRAKREAMFTRASLTIRALLKGATYLVAIDELAGLYLRLQFEQAALLDFRLGPRL